MISSSKTRNVVNTESAGATPLVTAIVATYNRANLVGRAIESILAQTYRNIEVIVVDDGSTDNTQQVLGKFGDQVRVITQANAGPGAARNRGIAKAQGEIVAFLDSDDQWMPRKIERQVSALQKAGKRAPCCICNAELRFSNGSRLTCFRNALLNPTEDEGLWSNATEVLADRFVLFNQMVAVRRSAFEEIGGFNEELGFLEDYDLALRLSLLGPFAFIREPLTIWNQGSDGLSNAGHKQAARLKEFEVKIFENVLKNVGNQGDHNALESQMRSALAKARRTLWIARLRQKGSSSQEILGYLLDRVQHYCDAVRRRSPWFIEMKTISFPQVATGSTGAST